MALVFRVLLAGLAALGLACALSYQSWKPVIASYSRSYIVGVLLPLLALATLQVVLSLRWWSAAPRRYVQPAVLLLLATAFAVAWASWIPEPRTRIFVILWLPALTLLALHRRSGAPELLLPGLGPVALLLVLFAGEWPMHPMLPVVNWGDSTTLAYLFPTREPYFGRGGRLRPNLRARMRSADYPGGAVLVTNADGFRMDETTTPPPGPSEYRILSLGDSMAVGYGASQAAFFGSLLEARLRSNLRDPGIKVLSAEVSDPAYGLYYLQRHGVAHGPKVVIYGLSGNDVMQCAQFAGPTRRFRFRADGLLEPNPAYALDGGEPPGDRDSLVSELRDWAYPAACPASSLEALKRGPLPDSGQSLLSALRTFRLLGPLWSLDGYSPTVMPSFAVHFEAVDGRKRLIDGYSNLGHYYVRDPERTRRLNSAVMPMLRGFKRACDAVGARFLLVVFPQRFQVAPPDWEAMRAFWNLDAADFDLSLLNRDLAAFSTAEGIELLDLATAFREAVERTALYLPAGDMHFNRRGNELAARATADFLADRDAPPVRSGTRAP